MGYPSSSCGNLPRVTERSPAATLAGLADTVVIKRGNLFLLALPDGRVPAGAAAPARSVVQGLPLPVDARAAARRRGPDVPGRFRRARHRGRPRAVQSRPAPGRRRAAPSTVAPHPDHAPGGSRRRAARADRDPQPPSIVTAAPAGATPVGGLRADARPAWAGGAPRALRARPRRRRLHGARTRRRPAADGAERVAATVARGGRRAPSASSSSRPAAAPRSSSPTRSRSGPRRAPGPPAGRRPQPLRPPPSASRRTTAASTASWGARCSISSCCARSSTGSPTTPPGSRGSPRCSAATA